MIRRDFEPWFRVLWNKNQYEIPGETMVIDLQVTKTLHSKEALALLQFPQEGSKRTGQVEAKKPLQVLQIKNYWVEVKDPQKPRVKGWAPLHFFEAPFEDEGVFVALIDTFLRKKASSTSEIITTVPRLTRLEPLEIEKGHLRVRYQGHEGYLDLSNLAGRGDFAMWAYHEQKGWLGISHRENGFLYLVSGDKYPLKNFRAFNPYIDRGVISQRTSDDGPSIRSRVTITHNKAHRWTLSQVEGHGAVWWRTEETKLFKPPSHEKQWTNEELLKREVTSVAFAGKTSRGLASANGVFRTEDSKTWTEIPQFTGQNYPVAIHPDGIWYVGHFRSHDQGKTFESYIKWDKLAEQIQIGLHKPPRHLRIAQIDPLPHSRLRILVDTGVQKVKMQAHVLSTDWHLVK